MQFKLVYDNFKMLQGYFEQTGSSKLVATTEAASATISKNISKIGKISIAAASIGATIVALKALDEEFDLAILGTKGEWYDHKVSVSDPQKAD